jgi:hypothetical protein
MMRIKQLLFITFAIFCLSLIGIEVQAQNLGNPAVTRVAEKESGDRFRVSVKTRKGANVYAVTQPSDEMLNAIDKGLDDLFAIARKHNYRLRLNYSDYSIYIARPDRLKDINGNYSPDIAITVGQYAGSIYDKGGYMYVAGLVIANNPGAFLIGEHTKNLERVSEVVRYEGEHIVLYHNDRKLYNETADHSQGGGHPILK